MNPKYKSLFETFTLPSGVTLKNRITMAPMTNFASHENGEVSDQELAYYRERSGGVGAVITACVYVTPDGKGFVNEFGADKDEMIPSLRRLADTIHQEGAKRSCKFIMVAACVHQIKFQMDSRSVQAQ